MWRLDTLLRRSGEALSARDLALEIDRRGFRRTTWREGTRESLSSRFAMQRVVSVKTIVEKREPSITSRETV